jgi:hypothetical protein
MAGAEKGRIGGKEAQGVQARDGTAAQ